MTKVTVPATQRMTDGLASFVGDRQDDAEQDQQVRRAVERAMADPRPSVAAEGVYARALALIAAKKKSASP